MLFDNLSNQLVVPNGTMGQRWEDGKQWNLKLEDEEAMIFNLVYPWMKAILN